MTVTGTWFMPGIESSHWEKHPFNDVATDLQVDPTTQRETMTGETSCYTVTTITTSITIDHFPLYGPVERAAARKNPG